MPAMRYGAFYPVLCMNNLCFLQLIQSVCAILKSRGCCTFNKIFAILIMGMVQNCEAVYKVSKHLS